MIHEAEDDPELSQEAVIIDQLVERFTSHRDGPPGDSIYKIGCVFLPLLV